MQKGQAQVLILAGIVILIAAVGGIFYLGRVTAPKSPASQRGEQTPVATSSTQPSPTPQTSPTADETVNWKLYTDPNGMFSFRYPASINQGVVSHGISQNATSILSIIRKDINLSPENILTNIYIDHPYSLPYPDGQPDPFTLTITVWINKENITNDQIKTVLLSYKPPPGPYQTSFVEIQDYQKGEIKGVYFLVSAHQNHEEIYMSTKDRIYSFSFRSESTATYGKTRKLIDQILSTFKFLP